MMLRFIGTLSLICFAIAVYSVAAQDTVVLDTDGDPVQAKKEYYVLPAATDTAGGLTLIDRNNSCPLSVGQEPLAETVSRGYPVTFKPFAEGETVIRVSRSFIATFSAASTCGQPTSWSLGERDPETKKRRIVAGEGSYFMIGINNGLYYFNFCPADVCPLCRFDCGTASISIENGKRLMFLDRAESPFFFRFVKV